MQYLASEYQASLDRAFAEPLEPADSHSELTGQLATLGDFGPSATFEALNSFTPAEMKRGMHWKFVETAVPYRMSNLGFGFVQYALEDDSHDG